MSAGTVGWWCSVVWLGVVVVALVGWLFPRINREMWLGALYALATLVFSVATGLAIVVLISAALAD